MKPMRRQIMTFACCLFILVTAFGAWGTNSSVGPITWRQCLSQRAEFYAGDEAVQCAVAWFAEARLEGIRQVRREDKSEPGGWDIVIVKDASAPAMWARFYDIGTNKPIFCSRDGIPKATLAEISRERRTGYSWLGYYATDLLAEDYPAWRKKWAPDRNVLAD
jgi:hypothetical protein